MTQPPPASDPGVADGDVRISTDPLELDLEWVHDALSRRAYWALGRTRADVEASVGASRCFGAFRGSRQVGFARVITDGVTFAWVCDVFVEERERGTGIGSRLMTAITGDPQLRRVRRTLLTTSSAAGLYERFGFVGLEHPERWMERRLPPEPE